MTPGRRLHWRSRGPGRPASAPAASEDVFLNFSDDASTWSAAIRVNDDVFSKDRLLPNVAVDSATDALGVAWYDFRSGDA